MKAQIRCMTIIKTREFILRPIRLTDAQGYLECHQDEDSKANFSSVPTTLEEAKKELQEGKNIIKSLQLLLKKNLQDSSILN